MGCRRCDEQRRELLRSARYAPTDSIYLDYNATTPVRREVLAAYEENCRLTWANPSSLHPLGSQAWEAEHKARKSLAQALGDPPEAFHFTLSGTAGLHAALDSAASAGWGILTTPIEHSALAEKIQALAARGTPVRKISVSRTGKLSLRELAAALKAPPRRWVAALSPVNHETGSRQPLADIAALVRRAGGLLLLDAVQAAARLPRAEWQPHADAYALSGHKIYAPKGIGALVFRTDWPGLPPEVSPYPGTPPTPARAALARAAELHTADFPEENRRLQILTDEAWQILLRRLPGIRRITPEDGVPGVLNFALPELLRTAEEPMEETLLHLGRRRLCVSRFSACRDSMEGPSPILQNLGLPASEASTSLRISLGNGSSRGDIHALASALEEKL